MKILNFDGSDLSEYTLFQMNFFCSFFFKLLTKFSDFINSDDCIVKSHQNLSDYIQFLF